MEILRGLFRGRAGGAEKMRQPLGASDIDATVDRVNPGGA